MTISDYQRYLDFAASSVITNDLEVNKNLLLTSILTVNPTEGGTIVIPDYSTVIYVTNTASYITLTFQLPSNPSIGKVLSIVSQVDITNVFYTNATFGVTIPIYLTNSTPVRLIYTGSVWILF